MPKYFLLFLTILALSAIPVLAAEGQGTIPPGTIGEPTPGTVPTLPPTAPPTDAPTPEPTTTTPATLTPQPTEPTALPTGTPEPGPPGMRTYLPVVMNWQIVGGWDTWPLQ